MLNRVILANITISVKPPLYADRPRRLAAMRILNDLYYKVLEAEVDCVLGKWTEIDVDGNGRRQYDEAHVEMIQLGVEHTSLENAVSYANVISFMGDVDDFDITFDHVWVAK